jgi:hypothetical protein
VSNKLLTKREMSLWLRTFGGCHERLCGSGKGWGFCDCILAEALRAFEPLSKRKTHKLRRPSPAKEQTP